MSHQMLNYLNDYGIQHQTSITRNAEQNGRAEKLNRILLEKGLCMLVRSGFPANFWAKAVATATYLSYLSTYVDRNKIQPKSKECKLLGFCTDQKGHRLWDLANRKIITIRDVVFIENYFS